MSPPSDGSTSPSPAITRGISPKPSRPKRCRCEPRLQCSQPEFALRSHERGIKCTFVTRPQKEAVLTQDLLAMIAALDLGDLRGLRDRAILLVGFAGGRRRSEIVRLDCGARQTQDGTGWTEILDEGILVTLRGKTGWREVEM